MHSSVNGYDYENYLGELFFFSVYYCGAWQLTWSSHVLRWTKPRVWTACKQGRELGELGGSSPIDCLPSSRSVFFFFFF